MKALGEFKEEHIVAGGILKALITCLDKQKISA